MVSLKSIKNFLITNTFLLILGLIEYWVGLSGGFINVLVYTIVRNFVLIYMIQNAVRNKDFITTISEPKPEKYCGEFKANVVITAFIESISIFLIKQHLNLVRSNDIFYDIVSLIPISFVFEIVFDLFHYITHRISHTNRYLYEYSHKKHHMHRYVEPILTFYQHPLDIVLTNIVPLILTLYILRPFHISLLQFSIMMVYKVFVEISGHHGKKTYPSSCFPQFMWLPKCLGIELYTEDHDAHHTKNNCNYAKRFSFWDKVFGTYK